MKWNVSSASGHLEDWQRGLLCRPGKTVWVKSPEVQILYLPPYRLAERSIAPPIREAGVMTHTSSNLVSIT